MKEQRNMLRAYAAVLQAGGVKGIPTRNLKRLHRCTRINVSGKRFRKGQEILTEWNIFN
jgi:hypothetical protein